jgi:hypothetical protein
MDEDALLPQIVFTVQETQRAFQTLLHNYRVAHGPDPGNLLALDVAMQALGTIVALVYSAETSGAQLGLIHWVLRALVVPSVDGYNISIADALIWDMRNLEKRLIELNHEVTVEGTISSPPGETMSIRRMVEKYLSIISKISSGQVMYVAASWTGISILTS